MKLPDYYNAFDYANSLYDNRMNRPQSYNQVKKSNQQNNVGILEGLMRSFAAGIGDLEKNIGGQILRANNPQAGNELFAQIGINVPTELNTQQQIGKWLRERGEGVIKANEPTLNAIPEDDYVQRFANDLVRSLPSSLPIMGGAGLAGKNDKSRNRCNR